MDKVNAKISKLSHRGTIHIKVDIPNTPAARERIKSVGGRKFSRTHRCWYIPNTFKAIDELKQLFEVETLQSLNKQEKIGKQREILIENDKKNQPKLTQVDIVKVESEHDTRVKVWIPWQRKDWIQQIKSLPNRAWNTDEKYWSVPKNVATLDLLKQLFGEHLMLSDDIEWSKTPSVGSLSAKIANSNLFRPASEAHLKAAKEAYQKEQSAKKQVDKVPQTFQTITKDKRQFKAVTGEKVIVEKENDKHLKVFVPYTKKGWIEVVKNIPGRKWNVTEKYWTIPFVKQAFSYLERHLGDFVHFNVAIPIDLPEKFPDIILPIKKSKAQNRQKHALTVDQKHALNQLEKQLRLEGKEWATIKSYRNHLKHFVCYYSKVLPEKIGNDQIKNYLNYQLKEKCIADSTYNQILNALRGFYDRALKQPEKTRDIPRPPKRRKLPNVMSKEEVALVIQKIDNLKHKTIVALMYATGLRVGEVVKLKVGDLNFDKKRLFVQSGKGNKDRYTILPEKIISLLKVYMPAHKVDDWLFEGQYGGSYSVRSVQSIVKTAVAKSRVKRRVTAHSFRHAFTTHMHDFGYSVEQIRIWLGHADISTTQGYLHVGNENQADFKSPFDNMEI